MIRPSHKDKDRGILLVRSALKYNMELKTEPRLYLLKEARNTDYEFRHWVYKNNKPEDKNDHWMSNIERLFQEGDFRYRERDLREKPLNLKDFRWAS